MLSLRIATRFLRRTPVQTVFLIAGITVGIGVQVFLGSLITSLQSSLVDQTIGSSSQVTVAGKQEGAPVELTSQRAADLKAQPQITVVSPLRSLSAIYRRGSETAPLLLKGSSDPWDGIYKLADQLVAGQRRLGDADILVGKEFAATYDLSVGDEVPLVLPDGTRKSLRISAIFDLGVAQVNRSTAFVNTQFARDVLKYSDKQYTAIETQLQDPFTSTDVVAGLKTEPAFKGLAVTDWQEENQDLLSALQSQSTSSYMIQVFVLIAVALGIASTLAISAVQKTRQIGILKAMGLRDGRAGLVFFWQAAIIGTLGSALGVGAGLALIGIFQLIGRNSESLFPITPEVPFVVISFFVGVAVALLSSIIPARRTSRVDPIEVIQSL